MAIASTSNFLVITETYMPSSNCFQTRASSESYSVISFILNLYKYMQTSLCIYRLVIQQVLSLLHKRCFARMKFQFMIYLGPYTFRRIPWVCLYHYPFLARTPQLVSHTENYKFIFAYIIWNAYVVHK